MPRALDVAGARHQQLAGAQLLEVLPEEDYRKEHLPGALNIPLAELTAERAQADLDPDRPILVYCYDTECDLSSRGAALLEEYGFEEVYDFTGSKTAWLAMGLPCEGTIPSAVRAGTLARPAATCAPDTNTADLPAPGPGGVVLVVDDHQHVLGSLRPDGVTGEGVALDLAGSAPSSVRPSIQADDLAASMRSGGESHVIVSRLDGVLLGIVELGDLDVDR